MPWPAGRRWCAEDELPPPRGAPHAARRSRPAGPERPATPARAPDEATKAVGGERRSHAAVVRSGAVADSGEEGNGTAPGAGRRWVTAARSTAVCVMRPGSREDAAEGVLPGDCGKDRALNSGHRAVAGCVPGAARSGVEGEIGRFRGRHMTPVPRAASLAELNQMLADADEVDEHRRIAARIETVGQAAAREVPLLNPLPGNAFRVAAALPCRVDAKARICVRQSYYSVPGSPAAGCRSRSALTGSTSGMTGFSSPGTPDQLHKGAARTWCWTNYLEVLVPA